jgi:hypothetical protein
VYATVMCEPHERYRIEDDEHDNWLTSSP